MSFEEFIEAPSTLNLEQLRKFKSKYSDLICENSDLITIINVLGNFTRGLDLNKMLEIGYKLEKPVEDKIKEYCEKWSLNSKVFKETLSFIMQLLKLFAAAIDKSKIDICIQNIISYKQPTLKQQSLIIDAICRHSYTNVARCVEVYKTESEKVKRLETLDYRQGRFFKSTFVKKTGSFYVYQTIIEIDGYVNKRIFLKKFN